VRPFERESEAICRDCKAPLMRATVVHLIRVQMEFVPLGIRAFFDRLPNDLAVERDRWIR
jgi:hypothetical protein